MSICFESRDDLPYPVVCRGSVIYFRTDLTGEQLADALTRTFRHHLQAGSGAFPVVKLNQEQRLA